MNYTLEEVKKSFNASADNSPMVYKWILRPFSFYVTFLLLRLGFRKPNSITVLGLLLGIASGFFFVIEQNFFYLGVLFYMLFMLFDGIDGNIARVTNSSTYFGKFLDGVVDTFVETLLPLSVATGFYFAGNDISFFIAGIATAIVLLFACFVLNRASFCNRWLKMDEPVKNPHDVNPLVSSRIPLKKIGNFLTDATIVILIAAAIVGLTKSLFLAFLLSIALWALAVIIVTIMNAAEQLNVRRVSKWDSRLKKE